MKKYIKKPIPIEALQWHLSNTDEVLVFGCGKITVNRPASELIEIQTLEGTMVPRVGDYVVKGSFDEFWFVKKEIFEATYEEVAMNFDVKEDDTYKKDRGYYCVPETGWYSVYGEPKPKHYYKGDLIPVKHEDHYRGVVVEKVGGEHG